MKTWLQGWLEARWYGGVHPPLWLRGLSRLYGWLARRRQRRGQHAADCLPVPVLVMDDGRIVERGSHRQLLAADGTYAALHRMQFAETG